MYFFSTQPNHILQEAVDHHNPPPHHHHHRPPHHLTIIILIDMIGFISSFYSCILYFMPMGLCSRIVTGLLDIGIVYAKIIMHTCPLEIIELWLDILIHIYIYIYIQ